MLEKYSMCIIEAIWNKLKKKWYSRRASIKKLWSHEDPPPEPQDFHLLSGAKNTTVMKLLWESNATADVKS